MTEGNRIVEEVTRTTQRSALEGAGIAQDFYDAVTKISLGHWTEGLVNVGGGLYAAREFMQDPLAKLISLGLGWVIEHVAFLREPLDWVSGDQAYLDRMTGIWKGVGAELNKAADDLHRMYRTDTEGWKGLAADAYRGFCADRVEMFRGLAAGADSVSALFVQCKAILAVVRTIIRDLITDFVGKVAAMLLRYPPPATPAAAPEAVRMAATYAQKIMDWVRKVQKAFGNATELFQNLTRQFTRARGLLSSVDDAVMTTLDATMRETRDALARELPKKIVEEGIKESAKGVSTSADEAVKGDATAAPAAESYLNDGPGPHRVSGDLS